MAMRPALCALVVALTMGAAAAPAQATAWRRVGPFTSPAVATGTGTVVAETGGIGLAVVGPAGVERRYDLQPDCRFANVAGGGRAVAKCVTGPPGSSTTSWQVIDLANGETSQLHLSREVAYQWEGGNGWAVTGIGQRWVQAQVSGTHYEAVDYWNPVSGELVTGHSERRTVTLDAERPESPLCSPVSRPLNPTNGFDGKDVPFAPFKQTGRFSVFIRWRSRDSLTNNRGQLFAWRCGRRDPVRVSACASLSYGTTDNSGCTRFAAGYGLAAWPTHDGVRVMDLRNGRRYVIREHSQPRPFTTVAFGSAGRIYASRLTGGTYTVFATGGR